ncbi:MAG: hypothetical protein IKN12_11195 [Selenomonadaceae bacterium]|nr:hypothetical protein [Selenomonadaceae bacterium]MBR3723307.1 hypothetical protein [Selenomonadaceae bacterium]
MTAAEFQVKARAVGLSDNMISCQIKLQEKMKREGLPGISYEDILLAKQQNSCMSVYESHLGA